MAVPNKMTSLAIAFSKKWEDASSEIKEKQLFLGDFLNIFGRQLMPGENFEYEVRKSSSERGLIDCLIKGKIAIEMKSRGKDLDEAFVQLAEYMQALPSEHRVPFYNIDTICGICGERV